MEVNFHTGASSPRFDGRYVVPGHGGRGMPVWGRQFLEDDQRTYGQLGGEALTQERIHELAEHIQSLQR